MSETPIIGIGAPWKVASEEAPPAYQRNVVCFLEASPERWIAVLSEQDIRMALVELEKVAHLIAAAPELYEALVSATNLLDECQAEFELEFGNVNDWRDLPRGARIRAALAKARGES